ncbi:MAG: F0F1 ATP synthase subunit A [Armatimonadetes bacterium]|nr:F0F1 ATP synthase subunit A [Armatimonadota bacterium]
MDGQLNALWVWTQTGIGANIPPPVFSVLSGIAALALLLVALAATRNMQRRPGWLQNLAEITYEFFDNLAVSVVGEHGRKYVPLAGTIFLFILFSNLMGLIPPGIAPTASLNTTIALALIVIVYVQYEGIRARGLGGYLKHFARWGEVPVLLSPLLFVIEIVSELAKPVSLSIRLYANMFGKEQVTMALITALAMPLFKATFIPLPIQFPVLLLGVLVAGVQAFVFSILTLIYLALATEHHEEHHGEHAHAH